MSAESFNSIGGLTVGIPPVPIVTSVGTVVANVNNDYVLANTVLTDNLRFSNGAKYVPGSNTQLIFNSSNSFAASANLTFNSNTNFLTTVNLNVTGGTTLGDVSNVAILGGLNGYFLQTDGLGTLSWAEGGGGGGNGSPGGSNTQVQFNNAGSFGGEPQLTYNNITNILTAYQVNATQFVGNLTGTATSTLNANTVTDGSQPNIVSVGTLVNLNVSGQITANVANANFFYGSAGNMSNIPAANLNGSVPTAVNVTGNAQANITSLGNLTSLTVTGNTTSGNLNSANRISGGNLFITGNASIAGNVTITTGNLLANGTVTFNGNNTNLGNLDYIHIGGGFNGQVLSTDGLGNLTWVNGGGGNGGGTPAGGNGAIQFNNGGIFGGSAYFTYNNSTNTATLNGNLVANTFQLGTGVYSFSKSTVFSATTTSTSANQVIWTVPSAEVSAVDFMIISTDVVGDTRTTVKISSTILNGIVDYNKYAGLEINGGIGNFNVVYDAGNVLLPPSLVLRVTPRSANTCNFSILITQYNELF